LPARWRGGASALGWSGALVLVAMLFLRPNLLGELYGPLGLALAACGAGIEVFRRRGQPISLPTPALVLIVPVCLVLANIARIIKSYVTSPEYIQPLVQDIVLTGGTLICVIVVTRQPLRRRAVCQGFVLVIALLSMSYVVTAAYWGVAGIGSGRFATFPVGGLGPQPVYPPFTVTESTQTVLGHTFPRFTGLGREPGWMALYCAVAYFLCPMVGFRSRLVKLGLLAGLVGTWSTAGFGVFVVVWTYHVFLRRKPDNSGARDFVRRVGGVALLGGAGWVAVVAPVFGLSAKATQNQYSLHAREVATQAGVDALLYSPFWGLRPPVHQLGINLISDIEPSGLPAVLLVTMALLLPAALQGPARQGHAVVLTVFLTLLTSQPPGGSTWVYVLAVLGYGMRNLWAVERPEHTGTG
jgi:hypothetical protein